MARYVVSVRTARSPEDAFAYMADLSNFAEWDPGVVSAALAVGEEPALGSAYDIEVKSVGGTMTLRYELTEFEAPNRYVAIAKSDKLMSVDEVTVIPDELSDGTGSIVTYDAELTLNGALGIADPIFQLTFNKIGDKAAAGLVSVLDGVKVER